MSTPPTLLYDWIRKIPTALKQLDEIPLLGIPPHFPWDKFAEQIKNFFQLTSFEIIPGEMQWRTEEDLLAGLGDVYPVNISIPPLEGIVTWVQPKQDLSLLFQELLGKDSSAALIDPEFQEGFNKFLVIEIINQFQAISFDPKYTPKILDTQEMPKESCLCFDLSYKIGTLKTFYGRLILSSAFRKAWKERYAQKTFSIPPSLLEQVEVTLHFEAGKSKLQLAEWKKVKVGDFLILDSYSLQIDDEKKERILITLNGSPLFRGKIKDGNVKILEHPLYYEVETTMNKNPKEDEFEDTEDESEFETEEEETEEGTEEEEETEEEYTEEETEEEPEEEYTEEEEEEELPEEEEEEEEEVSEEESKVSQAKEEKPEKKKAEPKSISPDEIPLNIIVEVGRLQMTIKKLVELSPGNILELDVHPENGVDLVVNDHCIAKGELLKIGDALGVRILEKGV